MWREILGLEKKPNTLVELLVPRRSFADVILPEETKRQLYEALTQIEKHRLIFHQWGLGERHPTGQGLVFNFAGPPGTGKTICAEAVAYALGRKLLRVRYSELESCWAGETGKNIRAVFREARAQDAVLFFDEADSIAARRFSNVQIGYEREANQAVNILLKELEEHEGVVIFATNMASNFDPAFERRIRTHILFRIPGVEERQKIWNVQVHPQRTPLGSDVNFRELAERFEISGGDIRNAVLKAAQIAAAEEGPDETKRILQRHLVTGVEQVIGAKRVMQQNALDPNLPPDALSEAMESVEQRIGGLDADLGTCRTELELLAETQAALSATLDERLAAVDARLEERLSPLGRELADVRAEARGAAGELAELRKSLDSLRDEMSQAAERQASALEVWRGEQDTAVQRLAERLEAQAASLQNKTILPWSRGIVAAGSVLALLVVAVIGALIAAASGLRLPGP